MRNERFSLLDESEAPLWRRLALPVASVLLVVAMAIAALQATGFFRSSRNRNQLVLGKRAPAKQIIGLFKPQAFGGLTREKIFKMRSDVVRQHRDLLQNDYRPADVVFKRIKDGAAWYSLPGFFYYGPGEKSVDGPSSESRFVVNPFLLVAPEFWGISIWAGGHLKWDRARIESSGNPIESLPLYPIPDTLEWDARGRAASVTYHVGYFLSQLNAWSSKPVVPERVDFGVTAYNARDLGLRYIYLSLSESSGITDNKLGTEPLLITDHLQFRGSLCGNKAGCNHRDNPIPALDTIKVAALPARCVFWLWRKRPEKASKKPDFRFIVTLD